ncbi:hypothetical protein GGX14DRAFT_352574, partial [Mycena pura]
QGDWDPNVFQRLLVEWLVACDQPFQEVERPEFRRLLNYVYHRTTPLNIPSAKTVKRHVMEMGVELEQKLSKYLAVSHRRRRSRIRLFCSNFWCI